MDTDDLLGIANKIKFIDLFAGVGGFHRGLITASEDFQCVYSNEYDKYANSVYRYHFGECDIRDIRTVDANDIPDHDLLCGGFPCQSFSIAGKRRGFEDTRGTMFFEIARILRAKQPRLLLLENVKGLLSHDNGKTFATIITSLGQLGYDCQWQVLNSKNFGVPQNRERVFIIGHLRGTPRPKVFPIRETNQKPINERHSICGEIRADETGGGKDSTHIDSEVLENGENGHIYTGKIKQLIGGSQGNRVYDPSGISTTIASQAGGLGAKTGLYAIPVLTPDRVNKRQNGRRMKTDGEPSFTLTGQDIHGVYDGVKIRRLTPVECMRLQGFPDHWCDFGVNGEVISDTQKYKMAGNAVTTNVITEIGRRLCGLR